jgi:hypothetical protein
MTQAPVSTEAIRCSRGRVQVDCDEEVGRWVVARSRYLRLLSPFCGYRRRSDLRRRAKIGMIVVSDADVRGGRAWNPCAWQFRTKRV